jgi:hypothetical protein
LADHPHDLFALLFIGFVGFLDLAAGEEICLDRSS